MAHYLLTLLFVILSGSSYASGPSSYNEVLDYIEGRIERNPCQYYLEQEDIYQCGKKGYLVAYGNYYCNRFIDLGYNQMSPTGKDWMIRTLSCLQESIQNDFSSNPPESCAELKDSAMKHHVDCYIRSGFCHLKSRDLIAIKTVVKSKDLFLNQNLKIINEVLKQCL